ncbi:nebulin-related-anchoring protein isoform X2 [Myxocyprinus asiaticus]|uniref:nebulin-related-anchoring protein isoform X2 n=1 Tax=Myxocyprinus asiaticus TaxID=70543 RepID=UPI0022216525|nr:nebulin-related-anchoring protein isoform X2 [Myxocyprinus asiaticus]
MNVQKCARCGFVVYPAEKINLISQNWHKSCFHCEVCKMVLTANNYVSHQKRPYCQVHNPKNNTFTSVYETPININAKKQSEAVSENKYREEGERFMSTFHYDMRSKEIEMAQKASQLASQGYHTEIVGQQSWHSGSVTSQEIVRVSQAQKTISDVEYKRGHEERVTQFTSVADTPEIIHAKTGVSLASDVKYSEEYQQSKGKGSFPAMITPGYEMAKKANTLASNLEYRKGHEERMSKYTTVMDTPDVLLAKNQGKIASDYVYTEEYEQQRGKGSFPAHFTPGYQVAKKAGEMASKVKYQQKYEQEIKGKASADAGASESALAKENAEHFSHHAYTEEYEQQKGKGSFPAMITPGYQMAKKAHDMASDLKYKKDLNKMKGSSAYHTVNPDDNLTLKSARKINKIVSEVEYRKDHETTKGHSINYCETPQFKNVSKIAKYTSDNKYKENYTNHMKGHYEGGGIDKKTMHAMNVRKLASNIAYKSEYEQEKNVQGEYNYPATITPSYQTQKKLEPLKDKNYRQHIDKLKFCQVTDTPEIVQARINAHQLSNLNYKANYEKTKTQYTISQDTPELKKAKANAELVSDIKYKENWEKNKSKACDIGLDTLTFKAAKASRDLASDIKYKESYTKNKDKAIGMDVSDSKTLHSLQVAKLSSEVAYKKGSKETQSKCHLPLDMVNLSHAKKAQALASDLDYRKKLHDYTVLPDDMKVQQAKKAYQLQSDNQYRSDLTWMKGVGWEADGCLDVEQAKKAGELVSEKKYRQKVDHVKFTQVADTPSIIHAKKSQELQSGLAYKAGTEQTMHQYTMSKDEPLFKQAKANAELLSGKTYKSSWDEEREKGFELGMDTLSILNARATRDLASDVKYKQEYEMAKGKMIGVKTVSGDSQMAHSAQATKLQSNRQYKKEYEDTKTKYSALLDMMTLTHAKKAQELATETNYKTFLHKYTSLPTDMKMEWAKKAYGLQSDKRYRSDLNWMKGVGWETTGSLDVLQARKATDLASEKKYRQDVSALKFTSVEDTPEMVQAKISSKLVLDRLYREKGENEMHKYTLKGDIPEHVQAKINATNLSESCYKKSWKKIRDAGYKLRLDAIPFQAAKSSTEILSDQKYKAQFEKTKGKMIGLKGLQDDINIAHSVYASKIQSDIKYKKDSSKLHSEFHLPMDMLEVIHAKKAQNLISDQDYRLTLHKYTTLPDDLKVQAAKKAYNLQSEKLYRSDLNYLRGAAWIATGALQIEGSKRATDLISEKKYRQQPYAFKHTSITDSPDIIHAKFSNKITNERLYKEKGENFRHNYTITAERPEITQAKINAANFSDVKYKESWHVLRAQGYKLTMKDIPFQAAKASTSIASDYQYKHNHLLEKGKHIGLRSVLEDSHLMHCMEMGRLQSNQYYRKNAMSTSGQYHLPLDMVNLVHAKNAQALASDQDYKTHIHSYTVLPDDMKVQWAKKAYDLQSQNVYKSDLNFMKGVAWDSVGAPQLESAKKAGELISDKKYRQHPDSLKFTQVADSPDIVHAKNSYMQCSERLYKSGDSESMHKFTLPPDHPDFIRAKINAQQISDKVYKTSGEQVKSAGFDLRLDAIPFQTAKASREIASDFRYKEAFVKDKGHQVGLLSVEDDPKMRHSLAVGKLQSNNEYRKQFQETRSQFKIHADQPEFLHAKKSQAQLSNLNYRQQIHGYTCDPDQLNVKHAKQAYQLQSDVNYKSDLNWIKGVGWTPPGSHKVEMARRAAELGLAEGVSTEEAIAQYQQLMMLQRQQQSATEQMETTKEFQQPGVNPDAMEILQVKRKKTIHTTFKQAKTTKSITSQSLASHSNTSQSITNQSTKKQSIMSQSHADESTARQISENQAITDQAAAKSGAM